jgi:hypothetical protein
MKRWLVVTGDVNEGFTMYGPFDSAAEADAWATRQIFAPSYVLAPLEHAA